MKKTVEQKAEIAKQKIDKKAEKQKQKKEKAAAKKENASAKKEKQKQQKAAKKETTSTKKQAKKELAEQKKAAKKEAAELKKKAKQEAANKIKALKNDAKKGKIAEKAEKAAKKDKKEKGKPKSKSKSKNSAENEGAVADGGNNKKKLFAGVLALVFVCGGVVGFLHFKGGNKEEEKDPYIEAYVLDDDFVTSIPKFLGESEKRALPEITEEQGDGGKRIVYDYTGLKDADEEVRDYINFLTSEKEFVPMFEYNLEIPAGYISVGTTSQEEGKILKLDIDYTETDYKVMVSKTTEELPDIKETSGGKDISRDGALNYLTTLPAEKLGMEKPVAEYKTVYDAGQSSIDGLSCYGISLYELGTAGTNVFQGKFFVATNQSAVFRYHPENDTYVKLEKTEKQKVLSNIESAEGTESAANGEDAQNTEQTDKDADKEDDETTKDKKQDDEEEKDSKKDKKVQKGRKEEREEQKQS